MEKLRHKISYAAIGASGGLASLVALSRCAGGGCTSCFGCAGAGLGLLLIALFKRHKKNNAGGEDGVA